MKSIQVLSFLAIISMITACGSKHDDNGEPVITEFNNLVIDLVDQSSPKGEPVNINELTIEFKNDDENAFESIL